MANSFAQALSKSKRVPDGWGHSVVDGKEVWTRPGESEEEYHGPDMTAKTTEEAPEEEEDTSEDLPNLDMEAFRNAMKGILKKGQSLKQ